MFNMDSIGRKIAECRKSKNITQMELADLLGISFQAVSNWERGQSMPDISKLPELAKILDISIDELLVNSNSKEFIINIIDEKAVEYMTNNIVTKADFKEIAPVLKLEQTDEIFENMKETDDYSDIADIVPFISQELIDKLVVKAKKAGNYKNLSEILMFANKELVNKMAEEVFADKDRKKINTYLPFISEELVRKFANELYTEEGLKGIEDLAPFMNREHLNNLAKDAIQKHGFTAISPVAPFLSKKLLKKVILSMHPGLKD